MAWREIKVPKTQLQLDASLLGGQSFRWKKTPENEYQGIFANIQWILKQTEDKLLFKVEKEAPHNGSTVRMKIEKPEQSSKTENTSLLYPESYYSNLLRNYFRLDINLEELYSIWSKSHNHFNEHSNKFYAVRVLDQDPVENIMSFICSQNNHIQRITGMVEKLCSLYGHALGNDLYTFPDVDKLSSPDVEKKLRLEGFGYRAKYIQKASEQIIEKGGDKWFETLQKMTYQEAHAELKTLCGIGPKVADCICLMSLNHLSAVPVDTHVFQLAKVYLPSLKNTKNVDKKVYNEIADKFREIYGDYAGWAQTVLFCSDLKLFKDKNEQPEKTKRKKLKVK